jgi:hypothetical protein
MAVELGDIYTFNNTVEDGQLSGNTLWPSIYVEQLKLEDITVSCDSSNPVAEEVLETYNIEYRNLAGGGGGALEGLDIKRMDAMTAVNWSLIERGANIGGFIEPIMASDGVLEFREIGGYSANISDVYYEISTGSYTESPKAVLVTGGKPLPQMRTMSWYPIWGDEAVRVYHYHDMLNNCNKDEYRRYASIVFQDPQTKSTYNDGIENLYEINDDNPWDRIAGYVKYVYPGPEASKDTKVELTRNATIFIPISELGNNKPNIGQLVRRPYLPDVDALDEESCYNDQDGGVEANFENGIKIEIPEDLRFQTIRGVQKDAFSKVSRVYVVGKKIDALTIEPLDSPSQLNDPTVDNCRSRFSTNEIESTFIRLDEGKHFVVAYDGEDPQTPYVVFINNSHFKDPWPYGQNHKMYVNPFCEWAKAKGLDGKTSDTYTVLPTGLFQGILVEEVWAMVDLNISSISIYDPDGEGKKATTIAQELKFYISPIVITEEPAPIAYASAGGVRLVDQKPVTDTDPTTAQDFSDRDIEQIMDEMQGGGMSITFSFLDENNVESMASMLYEHFRSDVVETIYTCGPNCNPILGGYGDRGGVINSIRYSYTDSGSYTVSVTEGQKLSGNLTPVDGGPTQKMAQDHSAGGTVIDQLGDNIHFKVRIEDYGERWAVNMAPNVIRVGDIVNCTVHNNPVEA